MNATTAATAASEHAAEESQPVIGTTIFWILLALCIASAWHPLGSSAGFPSRIRRHVRTLPLTAMLDTTMLYAELVIYFIRNRQHQSFWDSAQRVAIRRLRANTAISDEIRGGFELLGNWDRHGCEEGVALDGNNHMTSTNWSLRATILSIGTDMRPRFLSNALVVFVYTKMHGIHGAPFSLAIATLYFFSWVGNEAFLFMLFGAAWGRNTRQFLALVESNDAQEEDTPLHRGPSLPSALKKIRLVTWSVVLLALQVIGLIGVVIWIIASRAPPPPTAPHPQQPESPSTSWLVAIFSLAWRIIVWFATPATWWLNHPGQSVLESEFLRRLIYFPPIMAIVFGLSVCLPALFLGIPALAVAILMLFALCFLAFGGFMGAICIHNRILSGGGYLNILLIVFTIVVAIPRVAFSASAVIWWARGWSMFLVAVIAVYYICLWDAEGTSKAWWVEYLG